MLQSDHVQHPKTPERAALAPSADAAIGGGPALPAWKAFVVQFSRDTGTEAGIFSGRVEHLSSGRRARFGSSDDLLATLLKLLGDIGEPEPKT